MVSILSLAKTFLKNDDVIDAAETQQLVDAATGGNGKTVKEHKDLQTVADEYSVNMSVHDSEKIAAALLVPIVVAKSKLSPLPNAAAKLSLVSTGAPGGDVAMLDASGDPGLKEHIAYAKKQVGNTIEITLGVATIGFNTNSNTGEIALGQLNGRNVIVKDTAGNTLATL
jgi:hypothetical protein